jgi:hypothetical protein
MAFVNEFISEEDLQKHKLEELWKSYDAWSWRNGRPDFFNPEWVIDRERNAFLVRVLNWMEVGRSGRSEPTPKCTWILDIGGHRIEVVLFEVPGTWYSFTESPFRVEWNLVDILTPHENVASREEVLQMLRDALMVFGYDGARRQIPNTIVTCNF